MLRSRIALLIPVALTIVGFGSNVESANAQNAVNNYDITANYKTSVEIQPFNQDLGIIKATIKGESTEPAPYGLNSFISETYGQLQPVTDPSINVYKFNADPGVFGLNPEPERISDRYFGGANELFGKANDSATINFKEGTIKGSGKITINSGTGIFKNALGEINFTEEDALNAPGTPSVGMAKLKFSMQTPKKVPEPTATTSLIGIGVIGAGLLLRRHRNKTTFS